MRYDEKEELEATGEWLIRIHSAGFAEELMYVPSKLNKLGVAPRDVVDRKDWLRDHYAEAAVEPVEEPASAEDQVEEPETQVVESSATEESSVLDYDTFGPWEWAGHVESMIEESIRLILEPDPELPNFNKVASMNRQRRRGKSARLSAARS